MAKIKPVHYFYIATILTLLCLPPGSFAAQIEPAATTDEVQVLTAGPIHEAFAEAVLLDPEPGIIVSKAPPPLIEEIPSAQKPEGKVEWIPGYWAWDEEREDYIWISGIWRVPPPNRQWVPGYWNPVADGYQWVAGYWADVKEEMAQYLPEPPESVEIGPSSNAPSPDHIWIPGCWIWNHGRYAWRPGYWAPAYQDWVWVPAHYSWTPRGYIFVSGYWDHIVIHRGVLFAPVFFPPRLLLSTGFVFSPGFIINFSIFDDALFLRPRYYHYYFGDYYARRYYRTGIYPWFSLHARRVVYDPIYVQQRWLHRNDHEWEKRLQVKFHERRDYKGNRPSRSFGQSTGPGRTFQSEPRPWRDFVTPLNRMEKTEPPAQKFQPLSEKERKAFTGRKEEVRTYQNERRIRESRISDQGAKKGLKKQTPANAKASKSPTMTRTAPQKGPQAQDRGIVNQRDTVPLKKPEPAKGKISKSPILDKPAIGKSGNKPPAQTQGPKPNPYVEPLQRRNTPSHTMSRPQPSNPVEQNPGITGKPSAGSGRETGGRQAPSENRLQTPGYGQSRGFNGGRSPARKGPF